MTYGAATRPVDDDDLVVKVVGWTVIILFKVMPSALIICLLTGLWKP